MTRLLQVLVRSAALVGLSLLFERGVIVVSDDPLGQGFIAFYALAALSAVWGAVDGWLRGTGEVIVVWLATAVLVAVTWTADDLLVGRVEVSLLMSELAVFVPLIGVLVAGPSIFTGAMASQVRPRRSAPLR